MAHFGVVQLSEYACNVITAQVCKATMQHNTKHEQRTDLYLTRLLQAIHVRLHVPLES